MILRRLLLVLLAFSAGTALRPTVRGEESGAPARAQALCDALLAVMKRDPSLDFAARKLLLGPEIRRDLDLELMTRLVVGPHWRNLALSDRQEVTEAFSDYCVAIYVQRFKSYSGERFEVDPTPTPLPRGDWIVQTKALHRRSESGAGQLCHAKRRRRLEDHRRLPQRHGQRIGRPPLGILHDPPSRRERRL